MDDTLDLIHTIKNLVSTGSNNDLTQAVNYLDLLHQMIVQDHSALSFEYSYSVDSEFDDM